MSGPIPLTERQGQLLDFLKTRRRAPTVREIMRALGIKSTSVVHTRLCELEERGFIRRMANRARAIQVIENPALPDEGLCGYSTDELLSELRRRARGNGIVAACEMAGVRP